MTCIVYIQIIKVICISDKRYPYMSFAACWDIAAEREQAERLMRRMQFLDKLAQEVRQLEERLDD